MTGQGPVGGPPLKPIAFLGLGFELVAPVLVGTYLGYRLDRWLDTSPWLLIVGALLGMAAGFLNFFRRVLPPKDGPR